MLFVAPVDQMVVSHDHFRPTTYSIVKSQSRVGEWRIKVHEDPFTGIKRCTVANKRITYQPGALGFRMSRDRSTMGAWYRIDDLPPVRWQDRYSLLIEAGVSVGGGAIDNPTGGIVWIPQSELLGRKQVTIRLAAGLRPSIFLLSDLVGALDEIERRGCTFKGAGR